jgi:hypothetical protein
MNKQILIKHIKDFLEELKNSPEKFKEDSKERFELIEYYQSYAKAKIIRMTEEDIYQYISKLWAMLIWGNKHYVIDKIIKNNGLENFKMKLADLVWSEQDIASRWDTFRKEIKGMGPAMISEILCKTHPDSYMLWNRRAYVSLNYLGVEKLPRYDYQLTGKVYRYLCEIAKEISVELINAGFSDKSLLAVDYFIWDELQVIDNLGEIYDKKPALILDDSSIEESKFIHNDTRDKISDIGQWLGFTASIEQKVSEGSQVDTVWEATIGNMGRVIYIFEVQTKGSIDSLILNLLKSINNPAVQGVVAVSDKKQLELIKKHAYDVKDLRDKLKYWNYESVLKTHERLALVNAEINELGLVPQGF